MANEKKQEKQIAKANVNANVKSLVGTSIKPISMRGRIFEGTVTKKFPKRIVMEFGRTVYVQKYERFYKKKTRLHARLPDALASEINVGDYIRIKETRPLSKIIHFIVLGKVNKEIKGKMKPQETAGVLGKENKK